MSAEIIDFATAKKSTPKAQVNGDIVAIHPDPDVDLGCDCPECSAAKSEPKLTAAEEFRDLFIAPMVAAIRQKQKKERV
jgi:hypothetical protein